MSLFKDADWLMSHIFVFNQLAKVLVRLKTGRAYERQGRVAFAQSVQVSETRKYFTN